MNKNRVDFANTLRGLAAITVLISHYYCLFWLNRGVSSGYIISPALSNQIETPGWIILLNRIPLSHLSFFDWGKYGVGLFFIISGFVIPFSLNKSSRMKFFINRIFRIYPTYFAGFSITMLSIIFCAKYFGKTIPYSARDILMHYFAGTRDIEWSPNIDGIIWTLEIEMKFYILCILLIPLFKKYSLWVFSAPIVLICAAFAINPSISKLAVTNLRAYELAFAYATNAQYILFMFIGVMFHYMHMKRINALKGCAYIIMIYVLFYIHWRFGPYYQSWPIAYTYAVAIITFTFAYNFQGLFKGNRLTNFLADVSYPLYVSHFVAGFAMMRILFDKGFSAYFVLSVTTITAFIVAWLMHLLIEMPSGALGKVIWDKLSHYCVKAKDYILYDIIVNRA